MRSATLVDATDLAFWANRRDAQGTLPQLLRRLVHATVQRVLRAGFRAGEGVQLAGWDGMVAVEQGNAFVPDGMSVWELSADRGIKSKADKDYQKRCADPGEVDPAQSTFVFVTPRRWMSKGKWAAGKAEGVWRQVRGYDADDLEAWLELAPAVHIWFSILVGKHPVDAVDPESFWADWSAATQPPISAELVLSGRSEVASTIHDWLRGPSTALALQAESRDEAVGVFSAALQQLPSEERVATLSRVAIVRSLEASLDLADSNEPLILVQNFDSREAIGRAARAGHRVLVPLGRADSASDRTLQVPRLSRDEAVKALVATGMPEDRARHLAALARRSMMSFRRKLALSPEVQQPHWARPVHASSLLPAMLAGGWSDTTPGDREAIATLAQGAYADVSATLVRWANEEDPPVRRVGDAWSVTSKEDAWSLLARYLTRDDLERFESVVLDVLGTPDPRFDLPEDQGWMAPALGYSPRCSSFLRDGLSETLAIMGARGDATPLSGDTSACDYATVAVQRLLQCANADWRVWASLSHSLPLLAEAAPDQFLGAVEHGLSSKPPVLLTLFTDQEHALFSSSPHTGLLWGLETLAWSPEYLARAAVLLAKLARIDPGGMLLNRPHNSLRDIFLPWLPQTAATPEQRLRVLDSLREREPEVAWQLLRQLLPRLQRIGLHTREPRWREWVPERAEPRADRAYMEAVRQVVARMLTDVGERGSRWQDLIEALPMLPVDQRQAVVERLASIDPQYLQPPDRLSISNALRSLISQQRSFPDADWALPKERVDRLCEVLAQFEPQEPAARLGWLFGSSPTLPEGRQGGWRAHREAVASARLEAIRTLLKQAGLAGLLDLVAVVERPDELGSALGRSELAVPEEDELLREHLTVEHDPRSEFARGFAVGRVSSQGREWAETKLAGVGREWSRAQRAQLLACLPCDARTFDLVEGSDAETKQWYWRLVTPYVASDTDVERAARELLAHGRPHAAVYLLAPHTTPGKSPPAALLADALEAALQTPPTDDLPPGCLPLDVSELLNVVSASQEIDENRVAALEWAYLPLVGPGIREPKILHRELARSPGFFAQIVSLVFCAEGEEPRELSAQGQARVEVGHKLLQSWRTVPGTSEEGTIDADRLRDWVRQAREAMRASGHGPVGDQMIGQVLSGSPGGDDGAWPHPAVRDLIEEVASPKLERGLEFGLYNSRGVVWRQWAEGGAQERQLAERYAGFATAIRDRWPRTAAMLRRMEHKYDAEARHQDHDAELREDLDR